MWNIVYSGDFIVDEYMLERCKDANDLPSLSYENSFRVFQRNNGIQLIYEIIQKFSETNSQFTLDGIKQGYLGLYKTKKQLKRTSQWYKKNERYLLNRSLGTCIVDGSGIIIEDFIKKFDLPHNSSSLHEVERSRNLFVIFDKFSQVQYMCDTDNNNEPILEINSDLEKSINITRDVFIYRTMCPIYNKLDESSNLVINKISNCENTILILSLEELCNINANIKRGLSYEQLLYDIANNVIDNDQMFSKISQFKFIIIGLDGDGYILIERQDQNFKYTVICTIDSIDGEYKRRHSINAMGHLAAVQAIIALNIKKELGESETENSKLRTIIKCSLIQADIAVSFLDFAGFQLIDKSFGFPINLFCDVLKNIVQNCNLSNYKKSNAELYSEYLVESYRFYPEQRKIIEELNHEDVRKPDFTFLNHAVKTMSNEYYLSKANESILIFSKDVLKLGLEEALNRICNKSNSYIPISKYEKLIAIDRNEIENQRVISSAIREYISNKAITKPLSIGVFGSPGMGKSYTINNLIKYIGKDVNDDFSNLTFNLSQMKNSDALDSAFSSIQNACMLKKIPIVFWDEFDSPYEGNELGWLKFFLAPMQDGSYSQGIQEYILGKSIFIFAGGICETLEAFRNKCEETGMRKVKAPDFLSRLKASLCISDVNPPKIFSSIKLIKEIISILNSRLQGSITSKLRKEVLKYIKEAYVFALYEEENNGIEWKEVDVNYLIQRGNLFKANGVFFTSDQVDRINIFLDLLNKLKSQSQSIPTEKNSFTNDNLHIHIIRRAIIFRQSIKKRLALAKDETILIEDGLSEALLGVDIYYYGARSIESLVEACHISDKRFGLTLSDLPSSSQIELNSSNLLKLLENRLLADANK